MLVLTRKVGERIVIDKGSIVITIVEFKSGINRAVKIGIDAPKEIEVDRSEVYLAKTRERERSAD